jgi:hypothetical protein
MYIKSYRILSISNKRAKKPVRRYFFGGGCQNDLCSGTSLGGGIEKLPWIGMDTDI